MTKENTFYFQDSYSVQLSQEQVQNSTANFDIYDFTYNTCLDMTLAKTTVDDQVKPAFSIDEWMDYIYNEYVSKPNLLYPYMYNANPLIVYGAIVNLWNDLNRWDGRFIGSLSYPIKRTFGADYRMYSIVMDPKSTKYMSLLSVTPLTIKIPVLGEVELITPLTQFDANNLQNSPTSRIMKIDVIQDRIHNQYILMIHKEEIMDHDNPIEIPGSVGIYLGENITTISLSDGNRKRLPHSLISKIENVKQKEIDLEDRNKFKKLMRKYNDSLKELNEIIYDWYQSVSYQLVEEYTSIYIENQPRVDSQIVHPNYAFESPSWLHFTSILHQIAKKENVYVGNVYRTNQYLHICNRCGTRYEQLPMIDDTSWGCRICHTIHDTDINAAKNILKAGILLGQQEEKIPRTKNFNSILHDCD